MCDVRIRNHTSNRNVIGMVGDLFTSVCHGVSHSKCKFLQNVTKPSRVIRPHHRVTRSSRLTRNTRQTKVTKLIRHRIEYEKTFQYICINQSGDDDHGDDDDHHGDYDHRHGDDDDDDDDDDHRIR